MVRKTKVAVVEHPRGGEGSVEFHHIVSEEELNGHGSMYAMAVLRPHSSVGWHYVENFDLGTGENSELGMVCGGRVKVLFYSACAQDPGVGEFLKEALAAAV